MQEKISAELVEKSQQLVKSIKPFLAGQGPEVQGAVLADLTSLWVAGHHPELRKAVLLNLYDTVEKLVPISEAELFGSHGFPVGPLS